MCTLLSPCRYADACLAFHVQMWPLNQACCICSSLCLGLWCQRIAIQIYFAVHNLEARTTDVSPTKQLSLLCLVEVAALSLHLLRAGVTDTNVGQRPLCDVGEHVAPA